MGQKEGGTAAPRTTFGWGWFPYQIVPVETNAVLTVNSPLTRSEEIPSPGKRRHRWWRCCLRTAVCSRQQTNTNGAMQVNVKRMAMVGSYLCALGHPVAHVRRSNTPHNGVNMFALGPKPTSTFADLALVHRSAPLARYYIVKKMFLQEYNSGRTILQETSAIVTPLASHFYNKTNETYCIHSTQIRQIAEEPGTHHCQLIEL